MLKNYFRTAWRNLRRNKLFSFINIIGLAIGISAALVIYLVAAYDFSFNRSQKDGDRIYRVVTRSIDAGVSTYIGGVAYPLADDMRRELAGLDLVAPLFTWFPEKLSVPVPGKEQPVIFPHQDHIAFADQHYFNLISYEWLAGSPKTSLSQPYQVVLTESSARLYFPKLSPEDIIGSRLNFTDTLGTVVTGIVRDLPYPTDFTGKIFISRATLEKTNLTPVGLTDWGIIGLSQLFVRLSQGGSPVQMESKIAALLKKHGINGDANRQHQTVYQLQPLSDLHFNPLYGNIFGPDEMAHKPALYGLLAVGAFLLLLACINFINLTTAQSSRRSKEIGIRKTIGSSRRQLVFQFLSETFVLTLLAMVLSIGLTPFLLKIFADFIPKGLHVDPDRLARPDILIFGVLLLITVSLLSGLYPAMVLSACRPVMVLKNQGQSPDGKGRRQGLRKMLTVSQFVVAQIFVIATLLVSKQIHYALHKDLGFKKDGIVCFYTSFYDTTLRHRLVLLNKLKAIPGISLVSLSGAAPFSLNGWTTSMKYKDGKKELGTWLDIKYVDTNYCRLYRIKLLAGSELPYSDTPKSLLINETYAHILGFRDPQEAIGKSIYGEDNKKLIIAGVVADFHQKSLHSPIGPLVLTSQLADEQFISVALAAQAPGGHLWKTDLAELQKAWSSVYPEDPFTYTFQDEDIDRSYKSEEDMARLLSWATGLAILISCMGLLGLVIFTTNQRTKEIGIRKILGASVVQVISLLSADFLKLIGWAFLIAAPAAWWGTHVWLNNFAYRTNLNAWVFLEGGALMGGMAFMILLWRTFRAAIGNPVESLRME